MVFNETGKGKAAEYVWRAPHFVQTALRNALQAEPWFRDVFCAARLGKTGGTLIAALIATAVLLPSAVALTTIGSFLLGWGGCYAPLWGLGVGLLSWFIVAASIQGYAKAERAIPSSFDEFQIRLSQLQVQMTILAADADPAVPRSTSADAARKEAFEQMERIDEELKQTGLPWVLATGYIRIWERLHRAEEALIEAQPSGTVIAGATYDELRLDGSKIDHCKELLERLRQAAVAIDPSARRYLKEVAATAVLPPVITSPGTLTDGVVGVVWSETLAASGGTPPYNWTPEAGSLPSWLTLSAAGMLNGTPREAETFRFIARVTDNASVTATKEFTITAYAHAPAIVGAVGTSAGQTGCSADPRTLARAVLRTVRRAINEFRDGRWNALVVARNRLAGTMILTGLAGYVLLAIAIIMGATKNMIAAASAFYLVGAIIGLLSRLYGESQKTAAVEVEDYGLSEMRLLSMPVLSGMAAIGGVILVALLPLAGSVFTHASTGNPIVPSLVEIFDLSNRKNLVGLLVAAVFGLTPGLLFTRLQQQAENYASDLKTSEVTQAPPRT